MRCWMFYGYSLLLFKGDTNSNILIVYYEWNSLLIFFPQTFVLVSLILKYIYTHSLSVFSCLINYPWQNETHLIESGLCTCFKWWDQKCARTSLVIYQFTGNCYHFYCCILLNLQNSLIGIKGFILYCEIIFVFIKISGILNDSCEVTKFLGNRLWTKTVRT